jgi:hypothetical protein
MIKALATIAAASVGTQASKTHNSNTLLIRSISQVMGTVVADSAEAYNATILSVGQLGGCEVVATSRVYDPEGLDIFGEGYFSFQVHVSQHVVVDSVRMDLETIQSIVESGFDVVTGGQSQFRNHLHSNPLFLSVISVKMRQGFSPPVETAPTMVPNADEPTDRRTWFPSLRPLMAPSITPSTAVSMFPSSVFRDQSSVSPIPVYSIVPTVHSSHSPTAEPLAVTTSVPSLEIEQSWTDVPGKSSQPSAMEGKKLAVTTAITGASAAFLVFCFGLALFLWYGQRQTGSKKRLDNQNRDDSETNDIPDIVRLGSDQRSWAESSMGEYVTAGWRSNAKLPHSIVSVPPLGSFDENSLYTSPHSASLGEDGRTAIVFPLRTPSSLSSPMSLDQFNDHHERVVVDLVDDHRDRLDLKLLVLSPRTSATSNGARNAEPGERENQKYYSMNRASGKHTHEEVNIIKIEPLDPRRNIFKENDDFTLDPSEIDVWSSCDLNDSEGRAGNSDLSAEILSKASSPLSSGSTPRVNRLVIPPSMGLTLVDSMSVAVQEDFEEKYGRPTVWVNPIPAVDPKSRLTGGMKIMAPNMDHKKLISFQPLEESTSSRPVSSAFSQRAHSQKMDRHPGAAPSSLGGNKLSPMRLLESMSIPVVTPEGNESDCSTEQGKTANEISLRDGTTRSLRDVDDGNSFSQSERSSVSINPWLLRAELSTSGQDVDPNMKQGGKKSHLSPMFRPLRSGTNRSDPAHSQVILARKRKIMVSVPRGKLGITLANR